MKSTDPEVPSRKLIIGLSVLILVVVVGLAASYGIVELLKDDKAGPSDNNQRATSAPTATTDPNPQLSEGEAIGLAKSYLSTKTYTTETTRTLNDCRIATFQGREPGLDCDDWVKLGPIVNVKSCDYLLRGPFEAEFDSTARLWRVRLGGRGWDVYERTNAVVPTYSSLDC